MSAQITEDGTPFFDVVIVGAGLSGIGAAHYLQAHCPDRSYTILEMRATLGGTWDLFRYPGIRSDSDMYTLGYAFRPWKEAKAIADGPAILQYIRDTAQEEGIAPHIQYHSRVTQAAWNSERARWTLTVQNPETQETRVLACNFLLMCSGYYRYEEGYTPEFAGREHFQGHLIHPQKWPEDLDYTDKKVVVVGSGATAVTLVPELAKKARKVVMLQRSPTYIVGKPSQDNIANALRKVLPAEMAYGINRWRNVLVSLAFYKLSRYRPNFVKKLIKMGVRKALGQAYDVDTHFSPRYNPWDQRLCLVPDNDLFEAIKAGKAEVMTDQIETFTPKGLRLQSGQEVEADIVVTATGLQLQLLGGMSLEVDGQVVQLPNHYMYRGMMLSDIPNMVISIGYTNASWTLKTDLTCQYVCRVLQHMRKTNTQICTPRLKGEALSEAPLLDFNSGYVRRALSELPRQGAKKPWKLNQNYPLDVLNIKYSTLQAPALEFKTVSVHPVLAPVD
ncbi:MAG: NAD(P)/FAD-dependent oxidoreductase [Microscillaceae bacterium]